ncbi:MAG: hypothetical protein ACRDYD_09375, partial [Acidimicrobiales bacterium]
SPTTVLNLGPVGSVTKTGSGTLGGGSTTLNVGGSKTTSPIASVTTCGTGLSLNLLSTSVGTCTATTSTTAPPSQAAGTTSTPSASQSSTTTPTNTSILAPVTNVVTPVLNNLGL